MVPPDAVNVVDDPRHKVLVPEMVVGAVDAVVTVTGCVTPEVMVLHGAGSTTRTQYVVLAVGLTVIDAPEPAMTLFPTVFPVPHWYTAPAINVAPVAVSVVLLPLQRLVVPLIPVGAVE